MTTPNELILLLYCYKNAGQPCQEDIFLCVPTIEEQHLHFSERFCSGEVTHEEMNIGSQIWNDYCMVDPRFQMGSHIFIMDFADMGRDDFLKIVSQKTSKNEAKYFQVNLSQCGKVDTVSDIASALLLLALC